jgi:hypothetical protein
MRSFNRYLRFLAALRFAGFLATLRFAAGLRFAGFLAFFFAGIVLPPFCKNMFTLAFDITMVHTKW